MKIEQKCPVCQAPVIGRSDKKYCSDQCRAIANKRDKEPDESLVATNRILRNNRNILKQLCPDKKSIVSRESLESLGFNFSRFTALLITQNRDIYYITYDYSFTPIRKSGADMALIVNGPASVKALNPWKYIKRPPKEPVESNTP